MTLQTWIALIAVAASAFYFVASAANGLRGSGGCASGCGSCGSRTCMARKRTIKGA